MSILLAFLLGFWFGCFFEAWFIDSRTPVLLSCIHCQKTYLQNLYSGCFCSAFCAGHHDAIQND